MSTVSLKWVESTLMVGSDSRGRTLVMGQWPDKDPGWLGAKASDLLLLAAAACSTHDVVNILRKQRQPLLGLEVTCTGDQREEPPHAFTRIHLHFQVTGDVEEDKVERAIQLSRDKYCSVINSINERVAISHDFEVIDQLQEEG